MKRVIFGIVLISALLSCAKQVSPHAYVSDPNLQKGLFAELKGDLKTAEEVYKSSPDEYWGKLLLADLYFYRLKDYDRALQVIESLEKKHPKDENVLYRKGLILEALRRYPEAGRIFEYVAVNFPNGNYFEDASQAVEEMFRRNFPETLAVYDGGYVSSMMLDWVLEQIPPFQRNRFDNVEGRKNLVERIAIEDVALREAQAMHLDTTERVRESLENQKKAALREAYYIYGVKAKAKATDKEIKAYYNAHKSEYREPGRIDLLRIGLKDSAKAYDILEAVKKGAKLDSLAADTSLNVFKAEATRRGELTIYDTYKMYEKLYNEAFKHDTNDVFVYHEDTLWMVVKVLKKKPPRYKTFDEVKNILKNAVESEKERKIYEEDRKRLKKFYGVKEFITVKDTAEAEKREGEKPTEEAFEALEKELPDTLVIITKLGEVITDKDIIQRIKRLPERYQAMYLTPAAVKRFIDNTILPGILEVAEAELRRYYLHYPTYSRLKRAYKDAMLVALYDKLVKSKVKVTDEDVKKYYEEHKDEFTQEAKVRVQRIVVKDRKTARKILAELRSGKVKADTLARKMTDIKGERGTSGYAFITEKDEPDFFKKVWRAPLEKWRLERLKDGRWVVYRVLQKQEKRIKPLSEVALQIEQKLSYEQEKKLYDEAQEYLKKKYNIKVLAERIERMEGKGNKEKESEKKKD